MNKLFVYGTLQPGQSNAYMLSHLKGTWEKGFVRGHLYPEGWGAMMGYPGIKLDPLAAPVPGYLFTSEMLNGFWKDLDDFEGEHYQRVHTLITLKNGIEVTAYIYALK